jgi:uncharacterized protein
MTNDFLRYSGNLPWLLNKTILAVTSGSHAYGLNTPTSDLDIKGVAVPPASYFHGFLNVFEQAEQKATGPDVPDLVIYDIRKFFKLAADCNPNIIEVLWGDPADVRVWTRSGRRLLDARALFLSKKVKHTFSGYAVAQLKRIKAHQQSGRSPTGTHAHLEQAYGYDTKHAMHLVRLMRMCREILTEGRVVVKRPDREELLAIRNGAWPYEKVVAWAEEQDAELDALAEKSTLPHGPNRVALDELCQEIVEEELTRA